MEIRSEQAAVLLLLPLRYGSEQKEVFLSATEPYKMIQLQNRRISAHCMKLN